MTDPDLQQLYNPKVADALREYTRSAGFPALVGMTVDHVEPGLLRCSVELRPELGNAVGMMHGGVIAGLIDHVLSITVYPLVEVGKWVATVEFKVNYLSTVTAGRVTATGRVLSLRRKLAVVRIDVDNDGEPVAIAQGTLYIRDRPTAESTSG
ncbi:MAG: PaaI family thioesterase [Myxococcota bacterium]